MPWYSFWMKAFCIGLFVIATLGAGWAEPDPVDQLVKQLSTSHGLWVNGISPNLDLPATATTPEVVAKVLRLQGHSTTHKIVARREVTIPPGSDVYTAVLVDTDLGRKIILLQFHKSTGWWSRVFAAPG